MDEVSEHGIGEDIELSSDGDYCNYYKVGDDITRQETNNQGGYTGYTTPTPYGSYQESDAHGDACQANGADWGQEVRDEVAGNNCWNTCGMHHYVSFHEQGLNDRPWAGSFGEPSLVVSAEADPGTFNPYGTKSVGAWGYVCPVVEDATTGDVLEYCLQEWRSKYNTAEWANERVASCSGGGGHNLDTLVSMFYPGTQYATEYSGSANTFVLESSAWRHYTAGITTSNLLNAINADKSVCGRPLSTNPANYALIGVEQGVEGWRELKVLAGSSRNLQLYTTYQPLPPEATTSAETEVRQMQATLNGTVNPKGADTHYYFRYGTTAEYGSSTSSTDAGSGQSALKESATISGLQPDTTYHYRIVAANEGGTVEGKDETFETPLMPRASIVEWDGTQHVYYRGFNGQLREWSWNGSKWSQHGWGYENELAGEPSAILHSNGNIDVYYRNTKGQIGQWWFGPNWASEWNQHNWGYENEVAGDPSAIVLPNGTSDVYYRDTKGQMASWWYGVNPNSEWNQHDWGYEYEVIGTPSAVAHSNNNISVYYRNKAGQLGEWWYGVSQYSEWNQHNWGYEKEVASNPSAIVLPNGSTDVYYRSNSGQLGQWWYGVSQYSEWNQHNWGYEKEVAGTPSAVAHSNNTIDVYYRATNAQIGQWWYGANQSSEWNQHSWGYPGAVGGDPSASAIASGGEDIYYGGTNLQMWQWWINGSSWNLSAVGSW